jgi:hypothetical protein
MPRIAVARMRVRRIRKSLFPSQIAAVVAQSALAWRSVRAGCFGRSMKIIHHPKRAFFDLNHILSVR